MWKTNPLVSYSCSEIPLAPGCAEQSRFSKRYGGESGQELAPDLLALPSPLSSMGSLPATASKLEQPSDSHSYEVFNEFQAEYKVLIVQILTQYGYCLVSISYLVNSENICIKSVTALFQCFRRYDIITKYATNGFVSPTQLFQPSRWNKRTSLSSFCHIVFLTSLHFLER